MQNLTSVTACLCHVDVRVGLERNDDVGKNTHLTADIRMGVERNGNRHRLAHHASDTRQQLTLAILTEIKVHRTMQPK